MFRLGFLLYSEHARQQRTKDLSLLLPAADVHEDEQDDEDMLREMVSVQSHDDSFA